MTQKLRISAPPQLERLMNYEGSARYLGIYYAATDARWNDGREDYPWSYWAYSPLINHPALVLDLVGADLGSDDTKPTHWLMLDRADRALYLGTPAEIGQQLRSQHPPAKPISLTAEQLQQCLAEVEKQMRDHPAPSDEEIFAALQQERQWVGEMVAWLDVQAQIERTLGVRQ